MSQVFCANEKPIKLCHNWKGHNYINMSQVICQLQRCNRLSHTRIQTDFLIHEIYLYYLQNSRHCDLITELGTRFQTEFCHIFSSIFHRYTLISWRLCSNAHAFSSFPFWRMSTMSSLRPSSDAHSSGDLRFIHLAPPRAQRYTPESLTNKSGLNNMNCFFGQGKGPLFWQTTGTIANYMTQQVFMASSS